MANVITHTAHKDDTFTLKIADRPFGKVLRRIEEVPAKREGRTRKETVFAFTAMEGFAIPETAARTMKELKEKLSGSVIPDDVFGALVAPLIEPGVSAVEEIPDAVLFSAPENEEPEGESEKEEDAGEVLFVLTPFEDAVPLEEHEGEQVLFILSSEDGLRDEESQEEESEDLSEEEKELTGEDMNFGDPASDEDIDME